MPHARRRALGSRATAGLVIAGVGLSHFTSPQLFEGLTKSAFPRDTRQHIYINGGVETALGLGLSRQDPAAGHRRDDRLPGLFGRQRGLATGSDRTASGRAAVQRAHGSARSCGSASADRDRSPEPSPRGRRSGPARASTPGAPPPPAPPMTRPWPAAGCAGSLVAGRHVEPLGVVHVVQFRMIERPHYVGVDHRRQRLLADRESWSGSTTARRKVDRPPGGKPPRGCRSCRRSTGRYPRPASPPRPRCPPCWCPDSPSG